MRSNPLGQKTLLTCTVPLIITKTMKLPTHFLRSVVIVFALLFCARFAAAETFRVATYNVESYLAEDTKSRAAKSAEARAMVRDSIRALKPDVVFAQEMR